MGTPTTCARCKCQTFFTRISAVGYEYICVPCKKKEEAEESVGVCKRLHKDERP